MCLKALLGVKGLQAYDAFQLRVLALLVGLQCCLTPTCEVTLWASNAAMAQVLAVTVLLERNFRAKAGLALTTSVFQLPCMTIKGVTPNVIKCVATEVTQRAEVGGLLVMDPPLVLLELGRGAKGPTAIVTTVAAQTRVERFVGF